MLLTLVVLSLIFIYITLRFNWLTPGGSVTASLIGCLIFYVGGWQWLTPLILFFITSSILSSIGKNLKHYIKYEFEKTSRRDAVQVLANAAIPLIFVSLEFLSPHHENYILYIVSVAAANADTWATEIGVYNKSDPRLITTFSKVGKGRSGAISLLGLLSALSGSLLITISSVIWVVSSLFLIYLMTLAAFFASLVDSFLGATIQAQYRDNIKQQRTEKKYDERNDANILISGFRLINNDLVNIIAVLSAPLIYILFIILLP